MKLPIRLPVKALAAAGLCLVSALATARVEDRTGLIDDAQQAQLNALIDSYAAQTDVHIHVFTVPGRDGVSTAALAGEALQAVQQTDGTMFNAVLLVRSDIEAAVAVAPALRGALNSEEIIEAMQLALLPVAATGQLGAAVLSTVQMLFYQVGVDATQGDPGIAVLVADLGSGEIWGERDAEAPAGEGAAPPAAGEFRDARDGSAMIGEEQALAWLRNWGSDLARGAARLGAEPAAFAAAARTQFGQFPQTAAVIREALIETYPGAGAQLLGFAAASIVALVLVLVVSRRLSVLLLVGGVLASAWIWLLSSFVELSLAALIAGAAPLLLRLLVPVLRAMGRRDTTERNAVVGGSKDYQAWLAAQRSKSPGRSAAAATSLGSKSQSKAPAEGRLPNGLTDTRSVRPDHAARPQQLKWAAVREQLHRAGQATPALDALTGALGAGRTGGAPRKNIVPVLIFGAAMLVVVFGPLGVLALAVLGFVQLSKKWRQIKPAHMSSQDFFRQLGRELQAASKLQR